MIPLHGVHVQSGNGLRAEHGGDVDISHEAVSIGNLWLAANAEDAKLVGLGQRLIKPATIDSGELDLVIIAVLDLISDEAGIRGEVGLLELVLVTGVKVGSELSVPDNGRGGGGRCMSVIGTRWYRVER